MDFKQILSTFTYRIEQKPDGGFVAYPGDPNLPHLEAPSRMELNQKIQQNIKAALAARFPGLPAESEERKINFHLEEKPGGGFSVHYSKPGEHGAQADVEFPFGDKLVNLVGKFLTPEALEKLQQNGATGEMNVIVNQKTFKTTFNNRNPAAGSNRNPPAFSSSASGTGTIAANDSSPITPETSNTWKLFRFLLFLLVACGLLYFFAHR